MYIKILKKIDHDKEKQEIRAGTQESKEKKTTCRRLESSENKMQSHIWRQQDNDIILKIHFKQYWR